MDRDDDATIKAAVAACLMLGVTLSTRSVQRMTQGVREGAGGPKRAVWGETVRLFLAKHSDTLAIRERYGSDTQCALKTAISDTLTIPKRSPRERARITKESSKPRTTVKTSSSLLPTVGEAHTPWAKEVERRTTPLGDRQLRGLAHTAMHDVACLFVVRFMRRKFAEDDKITRKAIGVAGQIRNVVSAKDHPAVHDLTVREFFAFGREVFAASGGYWERPWDVVTWAEAPEEVTE